MNQFTKVDRTMLVMATGGGKTNVFSEVASLFLEKPGSRVMVLANRKELIHQAQERLQLITGISAEIEMAEEWSGTNARIVCGSLQTVMKRLERWEPNHFDLLVGDEFHHFRAKTYQKVWDHFQCKKLGVTATPDRGDKKALGKLVDSVAYSFDIINGIEQGYLVPIKGRSVTVEEIDISNVETTAGDLQAGQLDEAIVQGVEGMVSKTLELEPDRQGIWFFPGVKSAELACDRINALKPGLAGFVCASTPKEERDILVKDFRSGRIAHLCNVGIATEGFDAPSASMVVIGRPTLSRALYAQMVGRGLRVLPGVVDGHDAKELDGFRRSQVAQSKKTDCVVFDYCGNSGKHSLVTPEDLLGGDYSDEEVKLAKKKAKESPGSDAIANLEKARAELRAMMATIQSKVKAQVKEFNPFEALGMERQPEGPPIAPHQKRSLIDTWKYTEQQLEGLTHGEAAKLIRTLYTRAKLGLASHKQISILKRHGVTRSNIGFRVASQAIDYLAKSNWRPDPVKFQEILQRKL